jgi:hypothetical protein
VAGVYLAQELCPVLIDGKQIKNASIPLAKLVGVATPAFDVTANKGMAASLTSADFQVACATAITSTPTSDAYVRVMVNGLSATLGDGVKTKDCYFSADSGTTAKTVANIAAGDLLYWVGSVAGYQLATTDLVDFDYAV